MAQPEQGGAMLAGPEVAKLFTFQFWELQLLSEVPQSLDGEMGTIMGGRHSARHTITFSECFGSPCLVISGVRAKAPILTEPGRLPATAVQNRQDCDCCR